MGLPVEINNLMMGGAQDYRIERSLRLRRSASAYLNRTLTTPTLSTKYTLSMWVKRGSLSSTQGIVAARQAASPYELITFQSNDTLIWYGSGGVNVTTNAVFRDPSAWYHFVFVSDTTDATAANRSKFFVNGVQQTYSSASYPTQNSANVINSALAHTLGSQHNGSARVDFFDGYFAEVHLIDGQALTPSSFAQTDAVTGVWMPKKYSGTYGTNGFYLSFKDNASTTALGYDDAGSNDWTTNNVSLTSGATYDSMLDSPTNYADGNSGRGNYCVLNPLNAGAAISDGNLRGSTSNTQAIGTLGVTSGKWYFETTITIWNVPQIYIGIVTNGATLNQGVGWDAKGWAIIVQNNASNGQAFHNGVTSATYTTYGTGDVVNIAFDVDAGKVWFGRNGTWLNSGNPAAGTNAIYSNVVGPVYPATWSTSSPVALDSNFGQRPFAYTPPSGFKALNTQNIPTPSIQNGANYFGVTLWTGTGKDNTGTGDNSPRTVSGLNMLGSPDLVWSKNRNDAESHWLFDTGRGLAFDDGLKTNSTDAETNTALKQSYVSAVSSTGFTITQNNTGANGGELNYYNRTYVSWCWDEGATPGFDIVTYTGNGANRTIAHNLGVAPSLVIVKRRDTTGNWATWHTSIPNTNYLLLNSSAASASGATYWNSTSPTSSVFSVGTSTDVNANTGTYVAYLWSEVSGFSRFGSYTGNGSADGPFVWCGFRPRWILVRASGITENWIIHDTARDTFNVTSKELLANASVAEGSSTPFDMLSNGFKIRTSAQGLNQNGGTYVFAAFAENPFKIARAR
jgi:hypothetical protein